MSQDQRICVGAFAGAHGVRGEAKIKAFTADPAAIAAYGPVVSEDGKRRFTLAFIRILKPHLVLVRAPEIANREDAQTLAGTRLYVSSDKLAPTADDDDEFYYNDLIGLAVKLSDGTPVAKITNILNFGAGDIIELGEIAGHKGTHLVPFIEAAVPHINIADGHIVLSADYLPDGSDVPDDGSEDDMIKADQ